MSLISELIEKKRDGRQLHDQDFRRLVTGISNHQVSDAQIAAFAMAVWFRDLDDAELRHLTLAMRDSGTVLKWNGLNGPVIDKHSTGGVGDLVSLVVAPMVAACGGFVPMISGRGLGHTGGTLDKLESIPGFNTSPSEEQFQQLVRRNGLSIIGQTDQLAPADRRIYAVRDVTATVASTALIVSSILSKKLAAGLDALVMDIKVGNGAFMENMEKAQFLANRLCRTAAGAGLACQALLSDMSQPMSHAAGNALEMREACVYLKGEQRHPRLHDLVLAIAGEMLVLGGLAATRVDAESQLENALASGTAAEKFSRMVADQDGPGDLLQRTDHYLAVAGHARPLLAEQSGWIESMQMTQLGLAVVRLGGGRLRAEDSIDHAVGLSGLRSPGEYVNKGEELLMIHARNPDEWDDAAVQCRQAIRISSRQPSETAGGIVRDRVSAGQESIA